MEQRIFGKRLSELRKKRGITQTKLGNLLNMSHSTVASWEVGTRDPDSKMIIKIADFFGVSTDYLLGQADDPSPNNETETNSVLDEKLRSLARDLKDLDTESIDALSLIVKSMRKRGREALDE